MDIGTYDHITSFFERVWADVLLITCQEFAQAFGILAKGCHKMTRGSWKHINSQRSERQTNSTVDSSLWSGHWQSSSTGLKVLLPHHSVLDTSMEFDSPVQPFGLCTEVVNKAGNTCMSVAPAPVFLALQEARKWMNHSKKRRVHVIWSNLMVVICLTECWSVLGLATVKLAVRRPIPGFPSGLGCKQNCPDVPTCMPQERKKRRLYDSDSGWLRAVQLPDLLIVWVQRLIDASPKKGRGLPSQSGAGPKRQRTAMEALRAWASEWPAKEPNPSTLDLDGSWWMWVRSHSF